MSQYIRLKRGKVVVFLHCEPTDKISDLKQKIEALLGAGYAATHARLVYEGPDGRIILDEEQRTVGDYSVASDSIVYIVLKRPTMEGQPDDWEDPFVADPSIPASDDLAVGSPSAGLGSAAGPAN